MRKEIMWKAIEKAPKNINLLGYSTKAERPFEICWNVPGDRFVQSPGLDDLTPTHFMLLPELPTKNPEGWLPLDQGPRKGYCLGYDECLKAPFVMQWHPRKGKYVATDGMGDEEPVMCMLLPSLEDAFLEVGTVHQAEVSWYWTQEKLYDRDHQIAVDDSVSAKVKSLVAKYGITDDTTYCTQFEGRLLHGADRESVVKAGNELAQHLATLEGIMPLSAFA
jgi:hypothetical protein